MSSASSASRTWPRPLQPDLLEVGSGLRSSSLSTARLEPSRRPGRFARLALKGAGSTTTVAVGAPMKPLRVSERVSRLTMVSLAGSAHKPCLATGTPLTRRSHENPSTAVPKAVTAKDSDGLRGNFKKTKPESSQGFLEWRAAPGDDENYFYAITL